MENLGLRSLNDTTFRRQFQKSLITTSHSTIANLLDSTQESHVFGYNNHYSNALRFLLSAIHTEKSPDRSIDSILNSLPYCNARFSVNHQIRHLLFVQWNVPFVVENSLNADHSSRRQRRIQSDDFMEIQISFKNVLISRVRRFHFVGPQFHFPP